MKRWIASIACAGALTGCGGSPTQSIDFKPPSGWNASPSMFGAQMWFNTGKGKGAAQTLMLLKLGGKGARINDISDPAQLRSIKVDASKVQRSEVISICGAHPARFFEAVPKDKSGTPTRVEMVTTAWGADGYVAIYTRPAGTGEDKSAATALRSICQKK